MLKNSHKDRYFMDITIPQDYSSSILTLSYSEIMNNKNSTLTNISTFINKPTPNSVSNFYDMYLNGRKELLEKYIL